MFGNAVTNRFSTTALRHKEVNPKLLNSFEAESYNALI